MYKQILEKKAEFVSLLPDDQEFFDWLDQSNLWCWIYSVFKITGQPISKSTIVPMLSGEIRDDIPLSLYAFAKDLRDIYADMKSFISMQADLDKKMLNRWAEMIFETDREAPAGKPYRLKNPVVREWDLIPLHFRSIDEELDVPIKKAARIKDFQDPLSAVSWLHLEIDRMYPYGENTVTAAFLAVLYRLMQLGIPMPQLQMEPDEYNRAVAKYVNRSDISGFNNTLMRSIYSRLDNICSMIRQAQK